MNLTCGTFPLARTRRCLASRSMSSMSSAASSPSLIPVPSSTSIMARSRSVEKSVRPLSSLSRRFFLAAVRNTGSFLGSRCMRMDRAGLSSTTPASTAQAKKARTAAFIRWSEAAERWPRSLSMTAPAENTWSRSPAVTARQTMPGASSPATRATRARSRRYAAMVAGERPSADRRAQNASVAPVRSRSAVRLLIAGLLHPAVAHGCALGQRQLRDSPRLPGPDHHHAEHPDGLGDGAFSPLLAVGEFEQQVRLVEFADLGKPDLGELAIPAEKGLNHVEV